MSAMMREAQGRWPEILSHFGVPDSYLQNKHGPCPICGGKDRYRFDNLDDMGTFICSKCGAGTGAMLLMRWMRWDDFYTTSNVVLDYLETGTSAIVLKKNVEDTDKYEKNKQRIDDILSKCIPARDVPEAVKYMHDRRLTIPDSLEAHPNLAMYNKGQPREFYPAIIAGILNEHGDICALHRIYILGDGKKERRMTPKSCDSISMRIELYPPAGKMGIAEGVETAIAASMIFKMPVWSVINAGGMKNFIPPECVKTLFVFGDNDESYTGQAAAFECAFGLKKTGLDVRVEIPTGVNDWNDLLLKGA